MAFPQRSHTELNPVQVSLLRLFNIPMSEEDMLQLKKVLVDHYSTLLEQEVNQVVAQKGYSQEDFDKMLNDPDQ